MKQVFKKAASVLTVISIVAGLLAGCGGEESATNSSSSATSTVAESTAVYPVKTDVTLRYWLQLDPKVASSYTNLGETPFAKELEKQTGIKVKFEHPAQGQITQGFSTMIASGDLPDIVEYDWRTTFPGGPEKAMADGYIFKLNDIIKESAPNLSKLYIDDPSLEKMVKTDNGNHYVFPMFKLDPGLLTYRGPVLRKDWLDDLKLSVPETIDEWYTVLKAFKEQKGATAPLSLVKFNEFNAGLFTGAYKTWTNYFVDDNGKIKYGPMEPGYKDFLVTMNKWYSEGLFDTNFSTNDQKTVDANITSGKAGATAAMTSSFDGWITAGKAIDPKYDLVAAPYPVLKKGEKSYLGQGGLTLVSWSCAAITATSKNPEIAAKLLDFNYSEAGYNLLNFGTEGTSYTMENGKAKLTDLIMKNPDKLPVANALSLYARSPYGAPMIQSIDYLMQTFNMPQQENAMKLWMDTDYKKHLMPAVTPTTEESSRLARLKTDIETLREEMCYKFIMGKEPISNFDAYMAQFKSIGIDEMISLHQAATDRYNAR